MIRQQVATARATLTVAATMLLLSACGEKGSTFHCRIESITDEETGESLSPSMTTEFTFVVSQETDVYYAGEAPAAGENRHGDSAFIVVSKLDGKFDGMQVQRGTRGTLNSGYCKKQ